MINVEAFLLFSLALFTSCLADKDVFYWKDYHFDGIPPDAFPGGTDEEGYPTYIGQTWFASRNHLLPTIIDPQKKEAYMIFGGERWTDTKFTQILCSTNNALFRWIPTNKDKQHLLTECRQVIGGYSPGNIMMTIGRANQQGRSITGRVYNSKIHNRYGLYIHDTTQEQILNDFEVLVYNCHNPWIEQVGFDERSGN